VVVHSEGNEESFEPPIPEGLDVTSITIKVITSAAAREHRGQLILKIVRDNAEWASLSEALQSRHTVRANLAAISSQVLVPLPPKDAIPCRSWKLLCWNDSNCDKNVTVCAVEIRVTGRGEVVDW
jgi:hypothetical protein